MTVIDEDWEDRYRRLAALAPRPSHPPDQTAIAATDLREGDRLNWGDRHSLLVTDINQTDFICATCSTTPLRRSGAEGPDTITIDLHPLEEILVHTPRPDLHRESTQ
jgi:hypothetical protein